MGDGDHDQDREEPGLVINSTLDSHAAAYRAKVHYHQAIRRLHAAGGPLREIAEAFRMSHQRVHQIINQAAEATRRRESQVLSVPAGKFGEPPRVCDKCRDLGLGILGEPSSP